MCDQLPSCHPERSEGSPPRVSHVPTRWTLRFAQDDITEQQDKSFRKKPARVTQMMQYYVYIMANRSKMLYTGVTNDLQRRVYEHQHHLIEGFTSRYQVTRLVYFEETTDVYAAIAREKQIKGWLRAKKMTLIESVNPEWRDLSEAWQRA